MYMSGWMQKLCVHERMDAHEWMQMHMQTCSHHVGCRDRPSGAVDGAGAMGTSAVGSSGGVESS